MLIYKIPYLKYYLPDISGNKREVEVDGSQSVKITNKGKHFKGNSISTTKYGPITFIPLNLYEQFKRFANFYFLIIAIMQVTYLIFGIDDYVLIRNPLVDSANLAIESCVKSCTSCLRASRHCIQRSF